MTEVKVKLNMRGLNQLMSSEPVAADLERRGRRVASAAGAGFELVMLPHKFTARAYVRTKDASGRRREARDKILARSLNAAR